jgi:hypothetical protein
MNIKDINALCAGVDMPEPVGVVCSNGNHMEEERKNEIMRHQYYGMQAMSAEEMAKRQLAEAYGARNAWPNGVDSVMLAQASMNFWRQEGPFTPVPIQPPPTLWQRLKRWIRA